MSQVIIVDDDASIRDAMSQWLDLAGFSVLSCASASECLERLPENFPGVVVSDVRMPGMDGLQLLDTLQRRDAELPVIMLTGHGDVPMAVSALRRGAYDFLQKPFDPTALRDSLVQALALRGAALQDRQRKTSGLALVEQRLLGDSPAMARLRQQISTLASLPVTVLVRGETGSGKEQAARCLHECGVRASHPFVAINCAAIPEPLFEAELFGHESGAFTGAQGKRIGKLEYAHQGTLFLDEIESLPLAQQAKLLRVLQEQRFERLGANTSIAVDVRIIAATKPDLLELARQGRFREDLAYRLNVAELHLPPLRERREDIALLYRHFARAAATRLNLPVTEPGADLLAHPWPGNVRELANAAERHVLGLHDPAHAGTAATSLTAQQEAFEAHCLRTALARHAGDIKAVLEELHLPRRTLNEKMQRHGLRREDFLLERS